MPEQNWNEYRTRREFIDKLLMDSTWSPIVQFEEGKNYDHASVEEYPTQTGPADYMLFHKKRALAAVEGKKLTVGPQNVLQQAQRYARGLPNSQFTFGEFQLPFIYSTNGKVIWFQDLRHPLNRSREVAKIHTPSALEEFLSRDEEKAKAWLKNNPIDNPKLRHYQEEAIEAIEKAIFERKRNMLVAMATGTGKTFTIVNLIYRLMKSELAKRILFLVDRRALAAQAVTELASFEAEPGLKFDQCYEVYSQRFRREDLEEDMKFDPKVLPTEYLSDPKSRDSFVYVCTIQRMRINLFGREGMFGEATGDIEEDQEAEKLDIPIHAFDVIIADECHRGYTAQEESKWREVLKHFDGIRIGLTATPAAHTTAFFKEVVYRYDYEQAVKEGYLVDYDAISVKSDITINGVFLKEGDEVGLKDTQTGRLVFDILEDERELEPPANEFEWTAPDRNRKIAEELKRYLLDQEEQLGHFPKTLIFAVNDLPHVSHCDQLIDILRDEFNRGDAFVQKITGSPTVDRPLQKIREFRNRQNPGIVVTVDMLSTGVDIPKIENIVFLRPAKSRILFEQMMGRGTRLCPEINKTHFTVFDCFGGTLLEYFRQTTSITAEAPLKPTRTIREIVNAIADNQDRTYNIRALSKRLQRIFKNITQESRNQFNYILRMDMADFAASLEENLNKHWQETMRILQNEDFLYLCENYQRPKRTFIVAETAEDIVTSEVIFRTTDGRELKPNDYLQLFEKFIRENPEHIEALEILLNRPRDFHTEELKALREKLSTKLDNLADKFNERNLRRAYNKELADIISIIRHAAKGEDFLTAETRVDKALAKVKVNRKFTQEQEKWLELIRRHLVANLLIEKGDFDMLPIFAREGINFSRLNKIFNDQLEQILTEINEAVLA
ncbi:MAG: restriction endonuclease subunit R [Omnitrophica WOR_2 bacterium SM23_29]|nr:MAG: restriction endonuclease subunit R [Omnitrophica WOR_2 bacterium SM23_29]